jgi:peptidoglycan/LPS O-acetylase OafA/YrhL
MTSYVVYGLVCALAFKWRGWIFAILMPACAAVLLYQGWSIISYQYDFGFVRGLMSFSLGYLTYAVWLRNDPRPSNGWVVLAVTVIAAVTISLHDEVPPWVSIGYPLFFALVLYLLIRPSKRVGEFLRLPPFRLVGRLSYGIYMIQFPIRWVLGGALLVLTRTGYEESRIAANPYAGDALVVLYVAVLLGVAWLSYRYFEDPVRRYWH